jgi:uncharacterized protein (TIGR02246 family)
MRNRRSIMKLAAVAQSRYRIFCCLAQLLVFLGCLLSVIPLSAQAGNTASGDVTALIQRFIKAQQTFDPATLKQCTTDNYFEVSPLGELDKRDDVLGFYDPAHRVEVPSASISDENLRTFGDTAVDIVIIQYTVAEAGKAAHDVRIRATFVAVRQQGAWKLASAHYTNIRPPAAQH